MLLMLAALMPLLQTNLETPWSATVFSTDSSDEGYGVVQTQAKLEEIVAEASFCELRGWCVSLEDSYADAEEAEWADPADGWSEDVVEAAEACSPPLPPTLPAERTYRVLHLCSGYRRLGDVERWLRSRAEEENLQLEVWSIDLAVHPDMDFTKAEVVARIVSASRAGAFHAVIVGPPCSTWSRARFRKGNGPRILRTRSEPWGRTDIRFTPSERSKLDLGTALLRASLDIIEAVCLAGSMGLLKHPRDPGCQPYPSIWALPEVGQLGVRVGLIINLLDQCRYEQKAKKATTVGAFGQAALTSSARDLLSRHCNHWDPRGSIQWTERGRHLQNIRGSNLPDRVLQVFLRGDDPLLPHDGRHEDGSRPIGEHPVAGQLDLLPGHSGARKGAAEARTEGSRSTAGGSLAPSRVLEEDLLRSVEGDRAHQHPGAAGCGGTPPPLGAGHILVGPTGPHLRGFPPWSR